MKCTENNVIATCCICNVSKKGLYRTISNFATHLKRKHPEAYAQFENSKVPINNEETQKPLKKTSINKKGANVSKENLEKAIMRFIIQDLQPFIRTESAAFQNLVAVCLGYPSNTELPINLMSEKTVKRKISALYDEHMQNLEKIFSKQRWFCLTMDIWSCKHRSYFGVSIHYIDEQTLERKSFVLSCQDFPSPHTHEHIAELILFAPHKK